MRYALVVNYDTDSWILLVHIACHRIYNNRKYMDNLYDDYMKFIFET